MFDQYHVVMLAPHVHIPFCFPCPFSSSYLQQYLASPIFFVFALLVLLQTLSQQLQIILYTVWLIWDIHNYDAAIYIFYWILHSMFVKSNSRIPSWNRVNMKAWRKRLIAVSFHGAASPPTWILLVLLLHGDSGSQKPVTQPSSALRWHLLLLCSIKQLKLARGHVAGNVQESSAHQRVPRRGSATLVFLCRK